MEKNCKSCYWRDHRGDWCINSVYEPIESECDSHSFNCSKCKMDISEYKYNNKPYCSDCIMKEFKVEESTTTHYHLDGEYLGDDNDYDSVICNLDDSIESL